MSEELQDVMNILMSLDDNIQKAIEHYGDFRASLAEPNLSRRLKLSNKLLGECYNELGLLLPVALFDEVEQEDVYPTNLHQLMQEIVDSQSFVAGVDLYVRLSEHLKLGVGEVANI